MSATMTKAAFARLCQISEPMVSKYARDGRLVLRGKQVDAAASLAALEGRLDEGRRRAALASLETGEVLAPPPVEARDDAPVPIGDKARKDKAEADLREMDLAERMGQLVDAGEVRLAIEDAVAGFWSEADRRLRQDTDEIAAALKMSVAEASELRRLLARNMNRLKEAYTRAMKDAADTAAPRVRDAA